MRKTYLSSILLMLCLMFNLVSYLTAQEPHNNNIQVEERIKALISRMTLAEKAEILAGIDRFDSRANERLGIPAFKMTDGPVGVRWEKATAFPASVCMAATWDPDLIYQLGQALGKEAKARGRNVLLAPCVNIHRTPFAGRNFESFGEDPYLAGQIATWYIKGVQSQNVVSTVKHFACNNQEFERSSIDAKIDERTLHEIYFPAFKAAVQDGGAWAVMSAYNRLNGHYCSSNTYLLTEVLKQKWGFKGFVMSDWGAVHSTVPTLYAGLDIEMPGPRFWTNEKVVEAIERGRMKESKIDDKVGRMLRAMFAIGLFDVEQPDSGAIDTLEHRELARKVAEAGIVLLKNENEVLPIDQTKVKKIAVIGPNASVMRKGGGGSSSVNPFYTVSPLDGLKNGVDKATEIIFAPGLLNENDVTPIPAEYLYGPDGKTNGLVGAYYSNPNFEGKPAYTRVDKQINFKWGFRSGPDNLEQDSFSIVWTGKLIPPKTSRYALSIGSDDGSRLYVNGELLVSNWDRRGLRYETEVIPLEVGKPVDIKIEYYERRFRAEMVFAWKDVGDGLMERALAATRQADVALVFAGLSDQIESEGIDRETLALPKGQDNLIREVAKINKNTVVILNSGAPVLMHDWIDDVAGLVHAWYPGQEGGNALANILLGKVNPSGKLVTTFFKRWEDAPAYGNYPGENDTEVYAEGVFVGYRYFDTKQVETFFPFGHGLSYTSFQYSDLNISPKQVEQGDGIQVSLKVKNTGHQDGAEVIQLYIGDEVASVERPLKELKSFKKVYLHAGEEKKVTLKLKPDALKFYDIMTHGWIAEPGKFTVYVGSSSKDIRLKGNFELK